MEELRKQLEECYDLSCESMKSGDVAGITKYYHEDCVMLWPGFKMEYGHKVLSEMIKILMSSPAPKNYKFTTDDLVMMSDDVAYERGHFLVTQDNGDFFNSGTLLVIWRKTNGKWLIEVDSFTNDVAPPVMDIPKAE